MGVQNGLFVETARCTGAEWHGLQREPAPRGCASEPSSDSVSSDIHRPIRWVLVLVWRFPSPKNSSMELAVI